MKYYEIWQNHNNHWLVYEVTDSGNCYGNRYCLFKAFKTKKGAENWAAKQWYRVIWR